MSRNYETRNTAIEVSTRIYDSSSGYFSVEDFLATATKIEAWLNKGGEEEKDTPTSYNYIQAGLNTYRYNSLDSTPEVFLKSSQEWVTSISWDTAEEIINNSVYKIVANPRGK